MQIKALSIQPDAINWKMVFIIFFLFAMLVVPEAMAAKDSLLPDGVDLGVPGAGKDDGWAKMILLALRFLLIVIFVVALGLGMGDSIFGIFRVINDARTSGDWGPAIKQIGGIIIAVIISLVLFALADKYVLKPISEMVT